MGALNRKSTVGYVLNPSAEPERSSSHRCTRSYPSSAGPGVGWPLRSSLPAVLRTSFGNGRREKSPSFEPRGTRKYACVAPGGSLHAAPGQVGSASEPGPVEGGYGAHVDAPPSALAA